MKYGNEINDLVSKRREKFHVTIRKSEREQIFNKKRGIQKLINNLTEENN